MTSNFELYRVCKPLAITEWHQFILLIQLTKVSFISAALVMKILTVILWALMLRNLKIALLIIFQTKNCL